MTKYERGYAFATKELKDGMSVSELTALAEHGQPTEWSKGILAAVVISTTQNYLKQLDPRGIV